MAETHIKTFIHPPVLQTFLLLSSIVTMSSSVIRLKASTQLRNISIRARVTPSGYRSMATGTQKKEFLCILPDKPGVLELRKSVKA